ncbi:hypothetical protein Hanom_Chr16g01439751 [Helianthus anomalus]
MYGTPTLSWTHIIIMNTWDTQESCTRSMIPYARLISAMILQQNCLPPESLWISRPVEEFNLASMKRHWKTQVQVDGHKYTETDDVGRKYEFIDLNAPPRSRRRCRDGR